MSFAKRLNNPLRIAENVVFAGGFIFIMYGLLSTYGAYMYHSIKGKGYLGAIIGPIKDHQYYISAVSIVIILNSTLVLWEIITFIIRLLRENRHHRSGYRTLFRKFAVNYKSTFLGFLVSQLLPKVILV
ncbi:MAG: hypothetical protein JSU01_05975, partial [Bacteroidetes bacterium]|nr:hypothetical protein [Bacteroidota bacterium]